MFVLLAGASIFSVVIWRVRAEFSGTGRYAFLIWNLFLAWIPFVISYFTYTLAFNRKWIYIVIPMAAFVWLIFFPNAPYILTDFQHLAYQSSELPVWYDVMMLIWFAFTGLLLGNFKAGILFRCGTGASNRLFSPPFVKACWNRSCIVTRALAKWINLFYYSGAGRTGRYRSITVVT